MKKWMGILCVVLLTVCMTGCGSSSKKEDAVGAGKDTVGVEQTGDEESDKKVDGESSENAGGSEDAGSDVTDDEQNPSGNGGTDDGQNPPDGGGTDDEQNLSDGGGTDADGGQGTEPADDKKGDGKKVLVAYFSATGTTKRLAEFAADITGADLYEIVPQEPYTDADLNYNDSNSRTSIEMNDASIKPAINGSVSDMGQYSVVFVGYPIWWGDAPHIIDTFMESYDFSGKTIVPFCTSGGSGIGSSARNLHDYTDGSVTWLDGDRLSSGMSREDMKAWISGLGLDVETN